MGMPNLKPIIKGETKIYARPDGWHYHLDKECPMLSGGDFVRLGYEEISETDIATRKLNPCSCAYLKLREVSGNEK